MCSLGTRLPVLDPKLPPNIQAGHNSPEQSLTGNEPRSIAWAAM
jgi:hypothetical protein